MRCMDKDAVRKAIVCRQQVTGQGEHLTEKDVGSHSLVAVSGCCPGPIHKGGTKDADSCGSNGGGAAAEDSLGRFKDFNFSCCNSSGLPDSAVLTMVLGEGRCQGGGAVEMAHSRRRVSLDPSLHSQAERIRTA